MSYKKKQYPFINPIIVTKDKGIIDGQYRFEICKRGGYPLLYVEIDNFDDIEMIKKIKREQKEKLEKHFLDNKIDGMAQIIQSSSNDRMEKFLQHQNLITSDKQYWQTLRGSYDHSNDNYKIFQDIKNLFSAKRAGREFLMYEEEIKYLSELNDQITIYRGMAQVELESLNFGVSWSLDRKIAEKFAGTFIHNYDSNGMKKTVYEIIIDKKDVVAYFNQRDENEIIYLHPI